MHATPHTYLNPVYGHDFPDPFVLKFAGEYWAYCTGLQPDGRAFGILHSRDLFNWREHGGALEPLPGGHTCYWAPEVVYDNGRFLMYYSVGNEVNMVIRVAVAEHPAGPFFDSGRSLTKEQFAIDAHVFVDDDGTRHLFYATDFLTHTHIGTGTVRDRMLDAFTLVGEPVPVTRARYDWQIYDPARREKGGVRWHTVEGPTVLKHKGRYYEMFSGGNWQNTTYGVSFASAERIDDPEEWQQICDGDRVLPILRTLPGKVTGPGHNSVVRAPDNRQLFCVYHRWAEEGRVMAIDRLDWSGERMIVLGPSTTAQIAPHAPAFADFFDTEGELGEGWQATGGRWAARGGEAVQSDDLTEGTAAARCLTTAANFVAEVTLRGLSDSARRGAFGVTLRGKDDNAVLEILLEPETRRVSLASNESGSSSSPLFANLAPDFDFSVFHLLRLEVDERRVSVRLDDAAFRWEGRIEAQAALVALATRGMSASFRGFSLTVGWEELFMDGELEERGWRASVSNGGANGKWYVKDRQLCYAPARDEPGVMWKAAPLENYEMVVNARLGRDDGGGYGFYPADAVGEERGALLALVKAGQGWALRLRGDAVSDAPDAASRRIFPLPASFDPHEQQQFRFIKLGGELSLQWAAESLGTIEVPRTATRVGLWSQGTQGTQEGAGAAFDLVRVTMINR